MLSSKRIVLSPDPDIGIRYGIEYKFLEDICKAPQDDGIRLVFADWLEDNGNQERAEFIRLQIQREVDPEYHGFLCLQDKPCNNCRRENKTLGKWGLLWTEMVHDWHDLVEAGVSVEFKRGFVWKLRLPEEVFDKEIKTFSKYLPLERIELVGKKPLLVDVSLPHREARWVRQRNSFQEQFTIFQGLYDLLKGVLYSEGSTNIRWYDTPQEANDDLSRACLEYWRSRVGY